jgi:hypothetical protein
VFPETEEMERVCSHFGLMVPPMVLGAMFGNTPAREISLGAIKTAENMDTLSPGADPEAILAAYDPAGEHQLKRWGDTLSAVASGTYEPVLFLDLGDRLHLVAGNTRCLAAQHLGKPVMARVLKIPQN